MQSQGSFLAKTMCQSKFIVLFDNEIVYELITWATKHPVRLEWCQNFPLVGTF